MSVKQLEDDLRQTLRTNANALVVEDRDFDPGQTSLIDVPDIDSQRTGRMPRGLLAAAVVIVVLAAAAVVVTQTGGSNGAEHVGTAPTKSQATPTTVVGDFDAVVAQLTTLPASALADVGLGSVHTFPVALPGPVLASGTKPRVIWVGAEYCPFCAAQRWPLIQALSRFGTFSGLKPGVSAATTSTGAPEIFPNTQTFSFAGSTYRSDYLAFEPVETETDAFKPLETLTPELQELFDKYDAPPYVEASSAGAIPFLDFANTALLSGASYDAAVLQGRSRAEIAVAIGDPRTEIAQAAGGAANMITAQLCKLTGNEPAAVCNTPTITTIEGTLPRPS